MANFIETEMLPVSKYLATSKIVKVPEFQRSYAWTDEEVSQLWEDLTESIENNKNEYFIGPIVVKSSDTHLALIDGQQRLTTSLILISIIRRIFRIGGDNERADWLRNKYFGEQDIITLRTSEKFFMNQENNDVFRNFVIDDASKELVLAEQNKYLKKNSNYLLLQAIVVLWESIEKYQGESHGHERLLELHNYLFEKVKILVLSVQDEADAYIIFETLNDRGRSLDTMDLLKNHLFSKAKGYLNEVKSEWEVVKEHLFNIDPKNRFLNHFWSSLHGRTSKTGLFRVIRDHIGNASDAVEFAKKLSSASRVYSALQNSSSSLWSNHDQETKKGIMVLRLLDSQQSLPVLMAAYNKFNKDEFRKLVNVMVVMAVRYNLICEGRTGVSSNYYAEIPKKINDDTFKKSAHVFRHLKPIYPSDEEFLEAFKIKSLTDTKKARYLLSEIENSESGSEKIANSDPDVVNLEHIMPKAQNQNWTEEVTQIPNDSKNYYVNRLGNMALVSKDDNKRVGSKSFSIKKEELFSRKSGFVTTLRIAESESWDKNSIEERQGYLADIAIKVWRIDVS